MFAGIFLLFTLCCLSCFEEPHRFRLGLGGPVRLQTRNVYHSDQLREHLVVKARVLALF